MTNKRMMVTKQPMRMGVFPSSGGSEGDGFTPEDNVHMLVNVKQNRLTHISPHRRRVNTSSLAQSAQSSGTTAPSVARC